MPLTSPPAIAQARSQSLPAGQHRETALLRSPSVASRAGSLPIGLPEGDDFVPSLSQVARWAADHALSSPLLPAAALSPPESGFWRHHQTRVLHEASVHDDTCRTLFYLLVEGDEATAREAVMGPASRGVPVERILAVLIEAARERLEDGVIPRVIAAYLEQNSLTFERRGPREFLAQSLVQEPRHLGARLSLVEVILRDCLRGPEWQTVAQLIEAAGHFDIAEGLPRLTQAEQAKIERIRGSLTDVALGVLRKEGSALAETFTHIFPTHAAIRLAVAKTYMAGVIPEFDLAETELARALVSFRQGRDAQELLQEIKATWSDLWLRSPERWHDGAFEATRLTQMRRPDEPAGLWNLYSLVGGDDRIGLAEKILDTLKNMLGDRQTGGPDFERFLLEQSLIRIRCGDEVGGRRQLLELFTSTTLSVVAANVFCITLLQEGRIGEVESFLREFNLESHDRALYQTIGLVVRAARNSVSGLRDALISLRYGEGLSAEEVAPLLRDSLAWLRMIGILPAEIRRTVEALEGAPSPADGPEMTTLRMAVDIEIGLSIGVIAQAGLSAGESEGGPHSEFVARHTAMRARGLNRMHLFEAARNLLLSRWPEGTPIEMREARHEAAIAAAHTSRFAEALRFSQMPFFHNIEALHASDIECRQAVDGIIADKRRQALPQILF